MGIQLDMVRAGAPVRNKRASESMVSLDRPAAAASLARARGPRPSAPIAAVQNEAQPDFRGLDRIGWAFSIATLIVWAVAVALVQTAAP